MDDDIIARIRSFDRDHVSQTLLIEGTQGVGKTNLLSWYESELQDLYRDEPSYYIIRFYTDPEPSFDGILRRLFQELGSEHLLRLAEALNESDRRDEIIESMRSHDVRKILYKLSEEVGENEALARSIAELAVEWFLGLRVLNKHRDSLGVTYRLDTVESKTQALRDIVQCSGQVGILKGIFLLLDELEKQDVSVTKLVLVKYLSAIRAIVDALPHYLFMMIALTPEARRRYFELFPAFQGRFQNIVVLQPIKVDNQAIKLYRFYIKNSRKMARETRGGAPGDKELLAESHVRDVFAQLLVSSAERGREGVTQRDFLNALHNEAEAVLAQ